MLKRILLVLCVGLSLTVPSFAQAPIEGQIDDPVFLKFPSSFYGRAENKNSISFYFSNDRKRCRAFYGKNYYMACQPNLHLSGKKAVAGVSITPAIEGEWRWSSDYELTFTPAEHWLAGQNYIVDFDFDGLRVPSRVVLEDNERKGTFSLTTRPLKIKISRMHYMQAPDDPKRKLVTARLSANYPVVGKTLEKRIELTLEAKKGDKLSTTDKSLPFDLQFQADQLNANLTVLVKKLPHHERYMRLSIAPGVQPEFGGQLSTRTFKERARVPSLSSYLAINASSSVIARSEEGTPQQILSLETNVKALPKALREKTTLYLLPFEHPVMGRSKGSHSKIPYHWRAANEVTPSILSQSKKIPLASMPEGTEEVSQFGFGIQAPPDRYLYVVVEKGLEAFGGYTLEGSYQNILRVPHYPHDIEIMQEGSILTLSGARKLSLHSRGTDRLQVEVAQVLPTAVGHFVSQTQGDIRNSLFKHWTFGKGDIARIDKKNISMAYVSPQASQYASFDFLPYLEEGRKGIFLLNIQGFKNDKFVGSTQQRFVLVTDMGLLVKHNGNKTRDVFLVSFETGKPVGSTEISVLSKNGLNVFTGTTDAEGHINLPDFQGHTQDRQPVAIVAQKGDDYAFIPYNRHDRKLNISRFDVGGTRIAAEGLNAFLFSDRGIYRPGETAHIGLIVKNADWQALPPALPLKVFIHDSRGRVIREESLPFSPPGLQEISLDTGTDWPTGTYQVYLRIAGDGYSGSLLGSTSIRVEEFEPDRLKLKTEFLQKGEVVESEEGWLKPEDLKARVTLKNLYGTPASNRKVKSRVNLFPARLSFKQFPDLHFYDPYEAKPRTIRYDLPTATTDKEGRADLALNLDRQERATYSFNLKSTGYEAGSGKGVTAYNTTLVSPMEYVIGFSTKANLGYLKKDKTYLVRLQALDPKLAERAVDKLSLTLLKKTYVSTLVKRGDGSFVYEAVPRESVIESEEYAIAESGTTLQMPTHALGDFVYRLKSDQDLVVAEIPFSVAGEGQRKGGMDREAVLKVKTNKPDYRAGESIELNISAPYTGAGLITLESDRVIAHRWFRTDKMETVQAIDLPEDFSGKGYVNVAFVRSMDSREIYLSPLSYAVVPFTANTEMREIDISLDVPEAAKPGELLKIKYKGNRKGKAVLFAVDEGILQVAKYQTPDPVKHFLLNRALEVETSQMLDLLMPEYALIRKLSADGGGEGFGGMALGKHLNPFKRRILAPAVYWSGIVDLETTQKSLEFYPPSHFNGQLRVMAVAVGEGKVGSAERDVTVRSDIVVTPNLPVFLAPGDTVEASVTIANGVKGSGKHAPIAVEVKSSAGLTLTQAPVRILEISEDEEDSVRFTVQATDELGPAEVIVTASSGEIRQSAEATLSVRPPVPLETTLLAGYARDGNADISFSRELYSQQAERELSVSALPTATIFGLLEYLSKYLLGCTEQIVSRGFPHLSLAALPELQFTKEKTSALIDEGVSTLLRRQTFEGGFSLWEGKYEPKDFVSVYALDFLVTAQDMDHPVPDDLLQNGLRYLREFANREITSLNDARVKAYAIYVLTRSGWVTTNEILHWLKHFKDKKRTTWKTDLSAVYLAGAYQMMQQKKLAQATLDEFEMGAFTGPGEMTYKNSDWKSYYNPFVKYAQYTSILARHFPERFAELDPNIVFKLADFVRSNRYNTLSSSYAIQALSDYATVKGESLKESGVVVKDGDRALPLTGKTTLRVEVPSGANGLTIEDDGEPLFFTVAETGYSRNVSGEPVSKGLEIERTYQSEEGEPLDGSIAIGDIVKVTLSIRAEGEAMVENVAIVELLPGGVALEPENGADKQTLFPEFVDRREDRMIIFSDVAPREQVYTYRLRAISKGTFQVPQPFAEAMYDLTKKAKGRSGTLVVQDENR